MQSQHFQRQCKEVIFTKEPYPGVWHPLTIFCCFIILSIASKILLKVRANTYSLVRHQDMRLFRSASDNGTVSIPSLRQVRMIRRQFHHGWLLYSFIGRIIGEK